VLIFPWADSDDSQPAVGIETVAVGAIQMNTWQQVTVTWAKTSSTALFYINGAFITCVVLVSCVVRSVIF
jgi:hypothetical protein